MCVPRGVEGDECHPFSHKVGINVMSVIIIFQCYTHIRAHRHTHTFIVLSCFKKF